ncbi:MAG: tyrosine-type recombinase/integrase [Desulfobacterales bacterium]|nr:tyrosine-type recombinase/integrase [Desulfobacterales bacterium]
MKEYFTAKREITINGAIEEYLSQQEAIGSLSPSSIRNRRYELNSFSKFCNKHKIEKTTDIHKNIVISYLKEKQIAKASKLGVIYVLIGFMDFMVEEELILDNFASSINKPKVYMPKADYLTFGELERIFQAEAQYAPKKVVDRNLLLFSLFTDLCLRVSEVINLKLEDVRLDTKEVWVTRKRSKVDNIPLNDDIVNKFLRWYDIRPEYKGNELSWVFLSSHGKQLKSRQVHYIVSQALQRANIVKRKQGPHLLRHSGASLKAQAGENIIMIQYLLGHENLNTTRRYLHFSWDALKEMVERSPDLTGEK